MKTKANLEGFLQGMEADELGSRFDHLQSIIDRVREHAGYMRLHGKNGFHLSSIGATTTRWVRFYYGHPDDRPGPQEVYVAKDDGTVVPFDPNSEVE